MDTFKYPLSISIFVRLDFEPGSDIRPELSVIINRYLWNPNLQNYIFPVFRIKERSRSHSLIEFRIHLRIDRPLWTLKKAISELFSDFDGFMAGFVRYLLELDKFSPQLLSIHYMNIDELLTDGNDCCRLFAVKLVESENNLNENIGIYDVV